MTPEALRSRGRPDHEGRDVPDLTAAQQSSIGRHSFAAVTDLRHRLLEGVRVRSEVAIEVWSRAPVGASGRERVATGAAPVGEDAGSRDQVSGLHRVRDRFRRVRRPSVTVIRATRRSATDGESDRGAQRRSQKPPACPRRNDASSHLRRLLVGNVHHGACSSANLPRARGTGSPETRHRRFALV